MSKVITKPRLVQNLPADFEEAPAEIRPEEQPVSKSRSEVEVWNSSFPRRVWLEGEVEQVESPQVRPGGHERSEATPVEERTTVSQILDEMAKCNPAPGTAPGLCRYCVRIADCSYPKPEGGVWHCDEYE